MTRDTYDKATVALDKTHKLQGIRDKIKRELPELEHDKQLKEWLSNDLFFLIESKIKAAADEFGKL
jgi:hypothetical protein